MLKRLEEKGLVPCDDPDESWLDPYDDLLVFSPPKLDVLVNVCHEIVD